MATAHKAIIVVDPAFGERLAGLPPTAPLWVVDSVINRSVAERLRSERMVAMHLTGITLFRSGPGCDPEQSLTGVLATVDLHHGDHSANPPYGEIEVYGATDTPAVRTALGRIGFEVADLAGSGVLAARRSSGSAAEE